TIAYPWLASAVTRDPVLVAMVMVAQRLPWLVFTLPAGVITDRVDRRRAMVAMDVCRCLLTLAVAFAVLGRQGSLPDPGEVDSVTGTQTGLYLIVLLATLLLGMAEVLRDNSGQTMMPALVDKAQLEKANGRMWSAEGVANQFAGPPLGSLLLAVAFSLPFFLDATSFFVAAALVFLIPGTFRADGHETRETKPWRVELAEGFRWLWGHSLLRPMAIILGIMNAATMIFGSTFVLFAQEVLDVGPLIFSVIGFGGAIGGVVGGVVAAHVTRRLGAGTCLALTLSGTAVVSALIGLSSHWAPVLVLFAVLTLLGIVWNVITVSLRQSIIPSHLLGRVNSVYRFFAWGMLPIGAAVGGLTVVVVDSFASREWALRATFLVCAAIHVLLYVWGRASLTTERLEAARAEASVSAPASDDATP
ncbi:MAG TPA: MFS transporter, partial [Ilumatobacteraceae bacterium]|nr:MFS transporter [Ilumatobacteraceae bacterium]